MALLYNVLYTEVDFSALRLTELVFQPEDEAIPFPFRLYEDQIPEEVENFPLFLSMNGSQQGLYNIIDVAVVKIQDNDGLCNQQYQATQYTARADADVDECADPSLNNCASNAMCVNSPGRFACSCLSGFVDVDPTVDCQGEN